MSFNNNNNKIIIIIMESSALTDVRPIAVGETLRRPTGKCICAIMRDRFLPFSPPISVWCSMQGRCRESCPQFEKVRRK